MDSSRNSRPSWGSPPGNASPLSISGTQSVLRQSIRPSQPARPDTEKEELRIQVSALRYELENFKQERDLMVLRHEKELRDLQLKADGDFKRAQAAESASNRAAHKSETLAKELKETQEQTLTEKVGLERKIRGLQDEKQNLQEEMNETQAQLLDQERQHKHQINELETIRSSLQKTLEELQNDLQSVRSNLQSTQEKLTQREMDIGTLETENIRLKTEGADGETLTVLKRELSDQVSHIRNLETANRDQTAELRHLRKVQKNVEVVEEQKKSLENQLQLMKDVESELGTLQIQKQILEDERSSWTSLLQENDQPAEFDSPEAVVKALLQERIEKVALVDKMGSIEAQFLEKDETIQSLEKERVNLRQELEKLCPAGAAAGGAMAESRIRARLERQRALSVKEVEYLRAQLKTFDTEEVTMNAEQSQFDEHKSEQIANLEKLVDEYRAEVQKAHEELAKREAPQQNDAEPRGLKRPLSPAESDAESERLSVLSRKNRTLQDSLSKSEQAATLLRRELDATKSQLKSLKAKSRTRILELRDNPTAEAENIKMSTLTTLREENRDLLAQLQGNHADVKVVPVSTLESMKLDIVEMEKVVADKEKRMRRLKEIWTAKSSEFREAVASLLGYKLDFLPNGRVRVTSMFHLSAAYRHGDQDASSDSRGPGSMGNGEENSIIFDGENGTMKISGGPNSLFAMEIKHLIKFWVEERKDIPCFLAAMTLDFYDKTTRAARM
ncbi:coiled-coil domain-containing protein MAD1 [Aspergillus clavatus NRRL 1]|uniref:Spindle assembly checkpoint component MAD1 n=1 Tax=Aspergillus clavatus (strain ATCC 1007 / CBS 513.65 / DSM 816 / NCTC 3887 / NRRL 1 / QM 1276 / 107) TaxID=344612 RepID=A1CP99_ASPCL|nr:M protein repeat protein [Aspergillus clavatus NRRL 1]EAW07470.1 M protein repeat protein [Aspergillus clavatus NRRL 1]